MTQKKNDNTWVIAEGKVAFRLKPKWDDHQPLHAPPSYYDLEMEFENKLTITIDQEIAKRISDVYKKLIEIEKNGITYQDPIIPDNPSWMKIND